VKAPMTCFGSGASASAFLSFLASFFGGMCLLAVHGERSTESADPRNVFAARQAPGI
jgi:hypothetical protein